MTRRHLLAFAALPALPSTDPAAALEMVGVSHRDPARVRALVERHPGLARAAVDWGFGDWETALGAASHVGNREIAEYLLAHGEVPTIFSAAMLGQLDLLKGMIAASPGIEKSYGPHGITLLSHARAGKSTAVIEYLTKLATADTPLPTKPLSVAERDSVVGKYSDGWVVDVVNDRLGINGPGKPSRGLLFHTGGLVFFPSGAPWAKIAFTQAGFTVTGAGAAISATRV